ncbi:MAG TPA: diguanylate cyclase [Patescibacteria group bacterium]|nr:diguanylate cyclase [Patescibacteria group bacterium]
MKKLYLMLCENHVAEFRAVVEEAGFDEVEVVAFPCLCTDRRRQEADDFLGEHCFNDGDKIVFCGQACEVGRMEQGRLNLQRVYTSAYCFPELVHDGLIEYVMEKGGYVVSLDWLEHWRENLGRMGFDQPQARQFFRDFCQELVLYDTGLKPQAGQTMKELAEYLQLPYRLLFIGLERVRMLVGSVVHEWRLRNNLVEQSTTVQEIRRQNAEYSLLLELIGKVVLLPNQREIIAGVKDLALTILGAQKIRYVIAGAECDQLLQQAGGNPGKAMPLLSEFLANPGILLVLVFDSELLGVIEMGDFLFPQHLQRYMVFLTSLAQVCSLAISNVQRYETLEKSRNEMIYINRHDKMTGLYNRTFFTDKEEEMIKSGDLAVFMFDVDGLKKVNDLLGHEAGDQLIMAAANSLRHCFREADVLARVGGDEFAALVPGCGPEQAEKVLQRLQEAVRINNEENSERPYQLSLSAGFAIAPPGKRTGNGELMVEADQAMYRDKRRRKMARED